MNAGYLFSDIIGSTYKNGPVLFMPDGQSLLCPNGNRLKLTDLKRNNSRTSNIQTRSNITNFAINATGSHALIASKRNCDFVNLYNDIVLHSFPIKKVKASSFSPDSRYVAVGNEGCVNVYSLITLTRSKFNTFSLVNKFVHSSEPVNSLSWSTDGRLIAAGGENRLVKIFAAKKNSFRNVGIFVFGERAPLVDVWFYDDNYGLLTIDRSGRASLWEASLGPDQLIPSASNQKEQPAESKRLAFKMRKRTILSQNVSLPSSDGFSVSATALNRQKKLLVTAFTNGIFCIFNLPELDLLQNFRASERKIITVDINSTGDWVAIGCGQGSEKQLLVWEWQSESYILRQQSHSQSVSTAAYSPDGSILATGAEDGKVKLWSSSSSLCLVTFTEHETGVTDVCFTQSGKAILSASLEGSIRAHDLKRYRNFRTLVAPKQTQLNLLCADSSGDIVAACSRELFEIYIWALETGQLLETLSGHSSTITGLATFENTLCSVSLDKTLRFWNILEGNCLETIETLNECLDVKYSPNGSQLAVLCYDSSINLFDTRNSRQIGTIETRLDIDAGRQKSEKIRKSQSQKNKTFTCIDFSSDGQFLLAGGQSNIFCLYSVEDRIRIRTFKLSSNLSLDGTAFDMNYRNMTEFGNLDLFDLSDSDEEETNPEKKIRLPGTRHTDLSERIVRPAVLISKLAFSPTGQEFAVVCTEGVFMFTLRQTRTFCPFQLALNVKPVEISRALWLGEHAKALSLALKLNDDSITRKVVQKIPTNQFRVVIPSLGFELGERLLQWIAASLGSAPSKHFHFYLLLLKELLYNYGSELKKFPETNKPALTSVHQLLMDERNSFMQMSAQNTNSLEYIMLVREMNATC